MVLQPQTDPVTKAVQQLAKKELLSFAAAVRNRICLGKPNKQQGAPGFSQTVDQHIHEFQPYLQLTGVECGCIVHCLAKLYACHYSSWVDSVCTEPHLGQTSLLYTCRYDN